MSIRLEESIYLNTSHSCIKSFEALWKLCKPLISALHCYEKVWIYLPWFINLRVIVISNKYTALQYVYTVAFYIYKNTHLYIKLVCTYFPPMPDGFTECKLCTSPQPMTPSPFSQLSSIAMVNYKEMLYPPYWHQFRLMAYPDVGIYRSGITA